MQNDTQHQAVIELDDPIKRGDSFITSLTVRKPKAAPCAAFP